MDIVASDHSPSTPDVKLFDTGDFLNSWGGFAGSSAWSIHRGSDDHSCTHCRVRPVQQGSLPSRSVRNIVNSHTSSELMPSPMRQYRASHSCTSSQRPTGRSPFAMLLACRVSSRAAVLATGGVERVGQPRHRAGAPGAVAQRAAGRHRRPPAAQGAPGGRPRCGPPGELLRFAVEPAMHC